MMDLETVYQGIQEGRRRALARGLSWVDEGSDRGNALLGRLFPHAGHAHVIGITGAPGVGKSTLVNALTLHLRKTKQTVGILAVDPSSPFTGGAILGDRIRMQDSVDDQGVYMRSLASRGHVGGLSRATFGALTLLDAAGFDVILIETVGAGQAEVDVMRFAQTVLVVLAPGLGDDIQAIKAGILEIGNIFVVNKGDREGADRTVRSLRSMLGLTSTSLDWVPPIIKTSADRNEGIGELVQAIEDHVRVPEENRLGQEGQGYSMALFLLDGGRIGIAAQSVGIMSTALERSLAYAREREQFGRPIGQFEGVQWRLADMATDLHAARLMTYEAAHRREEGPAQRPLFAMAKLFASEKAVQHAADAIQIFGGYGYMREYGVERLLRDAKVTEIYEGTSEIMRLVIASRLLKEYDLGNI
ncbi:methylmalonyl Co-A mutase-associated GTPase MeaB [Sulfobacillus thermotolerans]|uniref:methylmalonyl Co-A mutase-associated GTPase MeaB n=1 Tax=Sulfobacillus thermotolerans TaxID=338644 RepID=UPI003366C394